MRLTARVIILMTLALSACVYRQDIKQGNFLKPAMLKRVKTGMTESQVRFVLGPPMVQDPFHPDRWDYVYYNLPSSRSSDHTIGRAHVVVRFKDGKVVSIEQLSPITPAPKNNT